jgi:hypothetical protein
LCFIATIPLQTSKLMCSMCFVVFMHCWSFLLCFLNHFIKF